MLGANAHHPLELMFEVSFFDRVVGILGPSIFVNIFFQYFLIE